MSNTPLIEVTNLSLKLNNADILSSITITSTNPGVTMVMGPNGAGEELFFEMLAWFSNTNEWVDKNFW